MSYKPRPHKINYDDLDSLLLSRLYEIMDRIQDVNKLSIDTDDIILISISDDTKESEYSIIVETFKQWLPNTKCIITPKDKIGIQILKRGTNNDGQ